MANDVQEAPHNLEAEAGVLGAMLGSSYACGQVSSFLDPGDFYNSGHRKVYDAIRQIVDAGQPVDMITVVDRLRRDETIDDVGGPAAIAALQAQGQPSHARAYAGLVKEAALSRQLITFGRSAEQAGLSGTAAQRLEDLQSDLGRLAAYNEDTSAVDHVAQMLDESLDRLRQIEEAGGGLLGIGTGLPDLDDILRGLQRGKLYVLAARPAVGKSAVAQSWINHVVQEQHPTLFFSMEMDRHELMVRMLAAVGKVNKDRMDSGALEQTDKDKIAEARTRIAALPLYIDDRPSHTMGSIRATAERVAMTAGDLDLIVVDYIGLIEGDNRRVDNRQNEVAKISRGLKVMAKELDVPVLALSQLSRKVEERPDKRPMLSDLRDSGSVEQDADVVISLYRDELIDEMSPDRGIIEIAVLKHRGGRTGLVRAAFLGHRFSVMPLARSPVSTGPV